MRKFLSILVGLIICCSHSWAGNVVTFFSDSGGGSTTYYVGYPNSSGTPSSPTGDYALYGSNADRAYGRLWAATSSGTAVAVRVRWGNPALDASYPADGYCWITLYNGTTLVGYANPYGTYVDETWVRYELTVVSGQSLSFDSSDNLRFGVAYDAASSEASMLSVDDGGPTTVTYYDSTNAISGSPNTTVTWSGPSATGGLCAILEYTN